MLIWYVTWLSVWVTCDNIYGPKIGPRLTEIIKEKLVHDGSLWCTQDLVRNISWSCFLMGWGTNDMITWGVTCPDQFEWLTTWSTVVDFGRVFCSQRTQAMALSVLVIPVRAARWPWRRRLLLIKDRFYIHLFKNRIQLLLESLLASLVNETSQRQSENGFNNFKRRLIIEKET